MSDQIISCPHCGKSIPLSRALLHDIESKTLEEEKIKIREELTAIQKQNDQKQAQEITLLKESLSASAKKLQDSERAELELRKQKNILDEDRRAFEINKQRAIDAERELIRKKTIEEFVEQQRLKDREKEQYIDALKKSLEDAQRKATQGSQQLQGEVQEIDMEETLKNAFPQDLIEPVAKGTLGADIRQTVKSPRGMVCGTILWESKRTKAWSDGWIDKLKQDQLNDKAHISAIASESLPDEAKSGMGNKDGVWVCTPSLVVVLSSLLRKSILDVAKERVVSQNKQSRAEELYSFITGHDFTHQVESMIEVYTQMKEQITKERTAYEKSWKLREMQVERLLSGVSGMYGSMQGIAGNAMKELKGAELGDEQ
ncbi:DUF2130 domain-containing protein [Candidatus Gottesmanbacteria bacterium]|nr:DUF2130 domain-containing protein [Candidatus Gottesmanbacteria bacterium]